MKYTKVYIHRECLKFATDMKDAKVYRFRSIEKCKQKSFLKKNSGMLL